MTTEYLETLLDYHYWARDRMLAAIGQLDAEAYGQPRGSSFSSVQETANHVFLAEWIWYQRWTGSSPGADTVRPALPDLDALRARWREQEAAVRAIVREQSARDIRQVFAYRMMNGTAAESEFWEMVVHVVNHATYHRGQVTTMLRQAGASPPESTDMITYFRSRNA
jgi:uncharacterized damage-inducible protein DinB